jgi:hypothetical protein
MMSRGGFVVSESAKWFVARSAVKRPLCPRYAQFASDDLDKSAMSPRLDISA